MVIAVLYVFATQYSRRVVFKFFWWTHQLYFVLYALTIIHGSGHLLQPPGFHVFLIGPAVLFTIDKLISMSRKKVEIPVIKAELLPSGITMFVLIFFITTGVVSCTIIKSLLINQLYQ